MVYPFKCTWYKESCKCKKTLTRCFWKCLRRPALPLLWVLITALILAQLTIMFLPVKTRRRLHWSPMVGGWNLTLGAWLEPGIQSQGSNSISGPQRVFNMTEDTIKYFTNNGGNLCFTSGGVWEVSSQSCVCQPGWWGKYCSFPKAIRDDKAITWKNIRPRSIPRRIICAFPINNEINLTEVRLHELGAVTDLFIFGESNFSSHGDPKPLWLLRALTAGFAKEFHPKILHVHLDHFDKKGISNGWVAEALQRNNIGEKGLVDQVFRTKPDDLFIMTDADEIPQKEMLLFLKNHNGFPEPFGFTLNDYMFGFYWRRSPAGMVSVYGGCTLAMVQNVLRNKVYALRNPTDKIFAATQLSGRLRAYIKSSPPTTTVRPWVMGHGKEAVGWHCSSCSPPEGIRVKMESAQNGDFPRWGDMPSKLNLTYIRTLILLGYEFNEKLKLQNTPIVEGMVPKYVLDNRDKFNYLLTKSIHGKPAFSLPRILKAHITNTSSNATSSD